MYIYGFTSKILDIQAVCMLNNYTHVNYLYIRTSFEYRIENIRPHNIILFMTLL